MMIAESTTVEAPRDRVFAVYSDIANAASRIPDIKRIEMLSTGPAGVGTRWRETRVMFGREASETMEITEFRPPEFYAVGADSCGIAYRTTFTFREAGPARTEVEMTFGAQPRTIMARIMGAVMGLMMKGVMRKCLASDLARLKQACETAH